ncbi:hypothetical protein PINS_up006833 [Pythium insidiosum]|nr:hypothetical protein PINS_up006833 [Pythium insidiosum]
MGSVLTRSSRSAISPSEHVKSPEKYSSKELRVMRTYLSSFERPEKSTEQHRQIAGAHWDKVFRETPQTRGTTVDALKRPPSNQATTQVAKHLEKQQNYKVTTLYDVFYAHLEQHSPELKPVFRSSVHIRGKVLVHISVGMRTLIASENFVDKVLPLTKTHRRFGVKPEHYEPLGRALLHAMQVVSAEH